MSAFTGDMHGDRAGYAPDHESLVAKKVAADAAPAQGRARRHLRTLVALQAGVLSALVFWVARRHLAKANALVSLHPDPLAVGYRPAHRTSGGPDAATWGDSRGPFPTNAWWQNLALGSVCDETCLAYAIPYVFDAYGGGLRASATRVVAAGQDVVQISHDLNAGVLLSVDDEPLGDRVVDGFGALGVGLRWDLSSGGSMYAPVSRGAAFATASYAKATPVVSSNSPLHRDGAVTADGDEVPCDGSAFEVAEVLAFTTDADYAWLVFPSDATFRCASGDGVAFVADGKQTVTLRVALATACRYGTSTVSCRPNEAGKGRDASKNAALFLAAAKRATPPTRPWKGDDVDWSVDGDTATLAFDFSDGSDLRCALPHHELDAAGGRCVASLHGPACPVVGPWTLHIPLGAAPTLSAPRPLDEDKLDALHAALDRDVDFELPAYFTRGAGDTYFSGKMVAKQARLAAIAHDLGRGGDAAKIAERILVTARAFLDPESEETRFLYDEAWGGLVSCGCDFDEATESCRNKGSDDCPGLDGCGNNFGNGFYNDHHYHYGYWAYAVAVACRHAACDADLLDQIRVLAADFAESFGPSPAFAIGIQLIPLTPYAELRDSAAFSRSILEPYEAACDAQCVDEGWSISLVAAVANAGDVDRAFAMAKALPDGAFLAAGGDGHSRTNLLHWVASRPPGVDYSSPTRAPTADAGDGDAGLEAEAACVAPRDVEIAALCPLGLSACVEGPAARGCSSLPWTEPDCARLLRA
ncbi:hypothetical protein JL721_2787 [Aureococcus anophagefferens]|nr:hypothetical protein JL721_2787 [Aureococcus anophagefferens]